MRGKVRSVRGLLFSSQDHPRVCGEKSLLLGIRYSAPGSPPRMRGKELSPPCSKRAPRITPAYAGKSPGSSYNSSAMSGSPPRMRGKGGGYGWIAKLVRITPAYAGKSCLLRRPCRCGRDHPRVCGEKCFFHGLGLPLAGSPPRMRGKAGTSPLSNSPLWITPAYAGKRLKRSRSTVPSVAIVPLFPSVCNKPVVSDGSPAGRDAPLFLPAENAAPASPAYNLRSL